AVARGGHEMVSRSYHSRGLFRRITGTSSEQHSSFAERTDGVDGAGIAVPRDIAFLAAGPASERSRSTAEGIRMTNLRSYQPDDAPVLLALFRDTIRRVNSRDYSPAQIAAWASDDIDPSDWASRFAGRFVIVAEDAGWLVGFAELEV